MFDVEVYRLVREKYAFPLSGLGASIKGARWNSVGTEIIYTAANRSLAMAEVAVHLTLATLPQDFLMLSLFIPDDLSIKIIDAASLPDNWNYFPYPSSTQQIGDAFVRENKYCVMKVPSVVTFGDFNILINPKHLEFGRISIVNVEKFPFDKRIFR